MLKNTTQRFLRVWNQRPLNLKYNTLPLGSSNNLMSLFKQICSAIQWGSSLIFKHLPYIVQASSKASDKIGQMHKFIWHFVAHLWVKYQNHICWLAFLYISNSLEKYFKMLPRKTHMVISIPISWTILHKNYHFECDAYTGIHPSEK